MNSIDKRLKRINSKLAEQKAAEIEPDTRKLKYSRKKSMYNDKGQIQAEIISTDLEKIVGLTLKKELSSRQKIEAVKLFRSVTGCMICSKAFDGTKHKHIDHCHVTGVVRGVLCVNCNVGLGNFKDNIPVLENAIRYLEAHKFNPDLIE